MISLETHPCDEGVALAERAQAACAERSKPWVLAATVLGSSLAFVNGSVVNVALPAIQTALDASAPDMQWIVNSYALLLAALILVGGSAGDHYGQRRIFTAGIALFTAASVGCGLAASIGGLIAWRAVQGLGGALLVPTSLAILAATFSEEERGKAIGTWAGFAALTAAVGPLLGGWLVDALSWRWVFFVVVPLALVALGITAVFMPPLRPATPPARLDRWGALTATLGLGGVTFGLIQAAGWGFGHPAVWGSLAGGVALLGLFIAIEHRSTHPMMPLSLFRSLTFSGANLLTLFLYFALGGLLFFLPFNLIYVQGYSATLAGAAFLPFTLLMGGLSRWSGGLVERYGARTPLVVGPLVAAVGFALFALPGTSGSYWTTFFPAMTVLGLGMAISVAPLTTVVMSAVEGRQAGIASGINNAASRVAWLLAVAVLGIVAIGLFSRDLDRRLGALDLAPGVQQAVYADREKLAAAAAPPGAGAAQQQAVGAAVDAAFVWSFRVIVLAAAALAVLSALCAALMITPGGAPGRAPPGR
ncbi:MAG: MFS transporter [Rhodothermales bacterium]|nr:MFS transporter [Rhodothermales bacterium]